MIRTTALAALTLVFFLSSADAVTLVRLSFSQLSAEANVIVYGRVADVRGQWTDDRRGIESLVTIDAYEYLKGRFGETIVFRTPGGQVGQTVNVWPGAPAFRVGDVVVLFLASRGPALPALVGLTQGVLRVSADPRSGELLARPRPAGVPQASSPADARSSTITLAQLAAQVRAVTEPAR